jgi:hypothetical protein
VSLGNSTGGFFTGGLCPEDFVHADTAASAKDYPYFLPANDAFVTYPKNFNV